jgi:acetyltransferase-like isoleucine patch superfamily enzyme
MNDLNMAYDDYTKLGIKQEGLEIFVAKDAKIHLDQKKLKVSGKGNKIFLDKGAILGKMNAVRLEFIGDNNIFHLKRNSLVKRGHYRFSGSEGIINIGLGTTIGNAYFLCEDSTKIVLGKDCMLSYDVEFRTTDAHSLIDGKSLKIINLPNDIIIGDHVWIGKGVCLLQGIEITNNVVVGTRALVTKSFTQENVAIAGVPAKVVRENVLWERTPPLK